MQERSRRDKKWWTSPQSKQPNKGKEMRGEQKVGVMGPGMAWGWVEKAWKVSVDGFVGQKLQC